MINLIKLKKTTTRKQINKRRDNRDEWMILFFPLV